MKLPIGDLLANAGSIADALTTTKEELRQFDIEERRIDNELLTGQMEINKEEAKHKSVFVAGWRPAIGWVAAISLFYVFFLHGLILWGWQLAIAKGWIDTAIEPPPLIDGTVLISLVSAMLGIGAMRSYDKKQGVSTESITSMSKKEFRLRKRLDKVQG